MSRARSGSMTSLRSDRSEGSDNSGPAVGKEARIPGTQSNVQANLDGLWKKLITVALVGLVVLLALGFLVLGLFVHYKHLDQQEKVDAAIQHFDSTTRRCLPSIDRAVLHFGSLLQTLNEEGSLQQSSSSTWNSSTVGTVWNSLTSSGASLDGCGVQHLLISAAGSAGNITAIFSPGSAISADEASLLNILSSPSSNGGYAELPSGGGNLQEGGWLLESSSLSSKIWLHSLGAAGESSVKSLILQTEVMRSSSSSNFGSGYVAIAFSGSESGVAPADDKEDDIAWLVTASTSTVAGIVAESSNSGALELSTSSSPSTSSGSTSSSAPSVLASVEYYTERKAHSIISPLTHDGSLQLALYILPASNGGKWYSIDSHAVTILVLVVVVVVILLVAMTVIRHDFSTNKKATDTPPVLAPLAILMVSVRANKGHWVSWPQEMSETLRQFEKIICNSRVLSDYRLCVTAQNGMCFTAVAGSPAEIYAAAQDLNTEMSTARWPAQIALHNELPVRIVCHFASDVEVGFDGRRNRYDYKGPGMERTRQLMLSANTNQRILFTEEFEQTMQLMSEATGTKLNTVKVEQPVGPGLPKMRYFYASDVRKPVTDSVTDLFDNPLALHGNMGNSSTSSMQDVLKLLPKVSKVKRPTVSTTNLLLLETFYDEWKTPGDPAVNTPQVQISLKNAFLAYQMLLSPFPNLQREELLKSMAQQFGLPHDSVLHRLAVHATMSGGIYNEVKNTK